MPAKKKTGPKVRVSGVIADGKGGYMRKGEPIEGASEETLKSLTEKGFVE